ERFNNPGTYDPEQWPEQWLEQQGFDLTASVKSPFLIEVLGRTQNRWLSSRIGKVQEYLFERVDAHFNRSAAGVIKASILGNGHYLDKETADNFRASGTYHILVISGSH